jgi:hypothetical protein
VRLFLFKSIALFVSQGRTVEGLYILNSDQLKQRRRNECDQRKLIVACKKSETPYDETTVKIIGCLFRVHSH